ncbi:hypothetical protein JKP88DRAFT_247123 [Tribonema minus]|uniref:Uncharacterized protein n=1 Tax=Tribonema minus TaxID=303371 RepID=A0A836CBW7_9STRA|nr:hypothetical protein JKP88DRAFT_247123 [Tribonema minus]
MEVHNSGGHGAGLLTSRTPTRCCWHACNSSANAADAVCTRVRSSSSSTGAAGGDVPQASDGTQAAPAVAPSAAEIVQSQELSGWREKILSLQRNMQALNDAHKRQQEQLQSQRVTYTLVPESMAVYERGSAVLSRCCNTASAVTEVLSTAAADGGGVFKLNLEGLAERAITAMGVNGWPSQLNAYAPQYEAQVQAALLAACAAMLSAAASQRSAATTQGGSGASQCSTGSDQGATELQQCFLLNTREQDFRRCNADMVLSLSDKALWASFVSPLQLSVYDENSAVGQMAATFDTVCYKQPHREFMVGAYLNPVRGVVELIRMMRQESGMTTIRSGRIPFEWSASNKGFQALAAFITSPPAALGYNLTVIPRALKLHDGRELKGFTPLAYVDHDGCPVTAVYQTHLQDKETGEWQTVALKIAPEALAENEPMYLHILNGHGMKHIPQVLGHGRMPDGDDVMAYLVTSPVGHHIGKGADHRLILQVDRDVASVIGAMEDISPCNVIIHSGRGILIDFHAAISISKTPRVGGKYVYNALSLHYGFWSGEVARCHCTATDLESLFYTLLHFASGGGAVRWRHMGDLTMQGTKWASMTNQALWQAKVLDRCQPELRPVVQELHELFFEPFAGGAAVRYRGPEATFEKFNTVLEKHGAEWMLREPNTALTDAEYWRSLTAASR